MNAEEKLFDHPINLSTDRVTLRIVRSEDFDELKEIAFDPKIWEYFTDAINNEEELRAYIDLALREYQERKKVMFVIINNENNKVIGMSALANMSYRDSRIEIGWSWIGTDYQGKGFNGTYKRMLTDFVFEELGMERLEFKTDVLNAKARRALIKIGTTEEGVLRSHTLMPYNRRRDTIYYSILRPEWEKFDPA